MSQRIQLLKDGLNYNSGIVNDACIAFLFSWLSSFDGDVMALLMKLDVEGSGTGTEMALTHIFKMIKDEEVMSAMQGMMKSADQTSNGDDQDVDCRCDDVDHQGDDVNR